MDSRDILVKQEEEYARILRTLRYDPDEINDLIYIFRKSKEYDESTINLSNESIFGYPQQGSIIRREKEKTWIDKHSKEYVAPFGFKNHKIVLPAYYSWIKKTHIDQETNHEIIDETCEPDMELIHNLCMVSSNIYFWYLLTYHQKSALYDLLIKNHEKRVFGHIDPYFTFSDLFDMLNRYAFNRCNQQLVLSCIRYEHKQKLDIPIDASKPTYEMRTMLDNNIERMITLEKQKDYFLWPMTSDVQIERNLRPYRAFIYSFVKDWLELFDIEETGGIDGRPNIKAVHVFTSFARE